MIDQVIVRVFKTQWGYSTFELALGHSGEYPRVTFRGSGPFPVFFDEAATPQDVLEALGEELFNWAPYAESTAVAVPPGATQGFLESSPTLPFTGTLDGGGRGGPAGDGQWSEGPPLKG